MKSPTLSDYQRDRITRFAAASESLHQNRLLLTTPGMTKPALALAMRSKKAPVVSEQSVKKTTEAFKQLVLYRQRSRRVDRLLPLFVILGAAITAYLWGRASLTATLGVALIVLLAAAGLKLYYSYLALRPILEQFQLTDEEAQFALNEVIADPQWEA